MGLLDELAGALGGKLSGGGDQNKLLENIMGLINNPQTGGLSGLARIFQDKGLGDIMSSWIGTGENLPISADQIRHVLGTEKVEEIAGDIGVSGEKASSGLAGMLPEIIDKLTPGGKVPQSDLLAQGLDMLKGKLFG